MSGRGLRPRVLCPRCGRVTAAGRSIIYRHRDRHGLDCPGGGTPIPGATIPDTVATRGHH